MSQARILGGNIGLALATIILNSHLTSDLAGILSPQQISNLQGSLNAIETFTPSEVAAVTVSFANAFKSQSQGCTGAAAACLVVSLFAWQRNPPNFIDLERERLAARDTLSGTGSAEV